MSETLNGKVLFVLMLQNESFEDAKGEEYVKKQYAIDCLNKCFPNKCPTCGKEKG